MKQRANEIQQLGNADLSLTDNDRGRRSKFLQQQGVTNNPAFQGNNQKDLSNCMPVQILGPPANHPSQVNSSGQKPSFGQNQLCLPLKLQGVAHTASGFGETMNNVNGEVSANISQVKNTTDGKVSNDDTSLSRANSAAGRHEAQTLLANDIYHPIPPQLAVNLLPPEEKEHGIFGVEAGKIYEIFYSKGTQLFSDEDLKMWLSRFNSRYKYASNVCVCVFFLHLHFFSHSYLLLPQFLIYCNLSHFFPKTIAVLQSQSLISFF